VRRLLALSATLVLAFGLGASAAPPVPVSPVVPGVAAAVVTSPNVTHVGTIALDGVGVSMRVVKVGAQVRAFVSGAAGLSIFDATNPKAPLLIGHLPFYNWENEDIAVSQDGKTAILSEFEGFLYLHVVDVSDPSVPRIVGTLAPGGAHTVECADPKCNYLFGSEGQTFDITDRTKPRELPRQQSWGQLTGAGAGHNVHQDAAGIWVSDTSPLVVFKLAPDPLHLKVLTSGGVSLNTAYQHNNVRPRADRYVPRKTTGGSLRDGELLLGQGETNEDLQCGSGSGAFSTWSMVGFDRQVPMKQLHVLRPVTGKLAAKDPAVNALGCSGHWFTEQTGKDGSILVAGAWYEHGTRILSVNPRTGTIAQVGYFQPQRGSTSASYWMSGNVIWSIDYHTGIDILAFDQSPARRPTAKATESSWLLRLHDRDAFADAVRQLCAAGAKATPAQHAALHTATP